MTTQAKPSDHAATYQAFWRRLTAREPSLVDNDFVKIEVEWGHETPASTAAGLRPDERLTKAETFLLSATSHRSVMRDERRENHRLPPYREPISTLLTRRFVVPIKDTVFTLGMTDALYYCSAEGERAIRKAVYRQCLEGLAGCCEASEVRLHVVAHSLGVTVAFDFLYGLFAPASHFPAGESFPEGTPGFVREGGVVGEAADAYLYWRQRVREGSLLLASKSSLGGQLPLFFMRKQKLVDGFSRGELLDPRVIGVPQRGGVRWKLFYDADDLLGYPARPLFRAEGTIEEYQVNTHWRPDRAHTGYWRDNTVVGETASLIARNLR